MTKAEINLIDEKFKGLTTLMNSQFINVHERLDEIKEQTTKTNGRVTELEKQEILHVIKCPNASKIRTLEDNQLSDKSIKRWLVTAVAVTGSLSVIAFGIIKLIMG